jgi:hypothetical protein
MCEHPITPPGFELKIRLGSWHDGEFVPLADKLYELQWGTEIVRPYSADRHTDANGCVHEPGLDGTQAGGELRIGHRASSGTIRTVFRIPLVNADDERSNLRNIGRDLRPHYAALWNLGFLTEEVAQASATATSSPYNPFPESLVHQLRIYGLSRGLSGDRFPDPYFSDMGRHNLADTLLEEHAQPGAWSNPAEDGDG